MERIAFTKKNLVIGIGLCTCLSLSVWTVAGRLNAPRRITETAVFTMDGIQLASIFEGLSPDPLYDIKTMPSRTPTVIPCAPETRTVLDKLKSWFQPSAFAQGSCPNTPCGGQYYLPGTPISCTASGCSGSIESAFSSPSSGPINTGAHENGTYGCTGTGCTQNICNFVTCDNGGTTCITCSDDGDYRCGSDGTLAARGRSLTKSFS